MSQGTSACLDLKVQDLAELCLLWPCKVAGFYHGQPTTSPQSRVRAFSGEPQNSSWLADERQTESSANNQRYASFRIARSGQWVLGRCFLQQFDRVSSTIGCRGLLDIM